MIGFCPLASGSKGNCIFLGTERSRILIDAGISVKAMSERLMQIGVNIGSIQAILVTHEHTDHIRGLPLLNQKWGIPIFCNAETAKGIIRLFNYRPRFRIFTTGEPFVYEDLEVEAFSVPHDTPDPVAFTIRTMGQKIGICTDLGHVTAMIRKMLEGCHYLYLEANHQPSMVHASPRPRIYKERVLGNQGHLSNEEAAQLLASLVHDQLKHVYLAHLSSECNSEEAALQIFREALGAHRDRVGLSIAYQDRISSPVVFSLMNQTL